jgi:RNA polymerase sigma-70 factor (ECF subfamily)
MENLDIATKKGFEKNDLEDILIIDEIVGGNKKAFGIIYDKYYNRVLTKLMYLCNGNVHTAEDLASEVMMKVATVIYKYNAEGGKFSGWINKVAKNVFLDNKRSSKNKFNKKLKSVDETFDMGESSVSLIQLKEGNLNVEEQLIKNEKDSESSMKLSEALKELSDIEIKLINLRYFAGLSFCEISEELGETRNYCLVKIKRTKEKLKKLMK